ncbi:membrane dipeptidase [Myxococcota bacterium]|nr:membrane dipeptidase [Myxococcota bacterium]MCZ7618998.1 membrane dipeptidase [Myxococcota bacterium]
MGSLSYRDLRSDPSVWARELGLSREAIELYLASDVLDLHLDSFIWKRIFGYDLHRRHGAGLTRGHFLSHVDLPRIREACVTGGTWVITTNPLRSAARRPAIFLENLRRLQGIFESVPDEVGVVRNAREYDAVVASGRHAAFLAIQGGNALDRRLEDLDLIPDDLVLRVTIVHLSSSRIGVTSSPAARSRQGEGLTGFGRDFVRRLDEKRILVDLAHINREGFWDSVAVHDPSLPLIVTHTGVNGVHKHWRNLDDDQLQAVADSGGVIGVMYQSSFLGESPFRGRSDAVVRHLAHIVETVGEDFAALGSDWDGAISPPRDLQSPLELPRLVEHMLRRRWSPERIQKVLGHNFLRCVRAIRG